MSCRAPPIQQLLTIALVKHLLDESTTSILEASKRLYHMYYMVPVNLALVTKVFF